MTTHVKLYADNHIAQILKPQVLNSDTLSSEIDMQGYQELLALVNVGLSADTLNSTNKIMLELQHSDVSGSGYVACPDAEITNAVAASATGTFALIDDPAEDETLYKVAYRGTKRYLKVNINFAGTHSTGTPIGVTAIKGLAAAKPVNAIS